MKYSTGLFAALSLLVLGGMAAQDARAMPPASVDEITAIEEKLKTPEAGACAVDGDCAVLHGACGDWLTVNRGFADDARKYYGYMATVVECFRAGGTEPEPKPGCQAGRCTLPAVLDPVEESMPPPEPGAVPDSEAGSYE